MTIITCAFFIAGAYVVSKDKVGTLEENFRQEIARSVQIISLPLGEAVYQADELLAQAVFSALKQNPDLAWVVIEKSNRSVFEHMSQAEQPAEDLVAMAPEYSYTLDSEEKLNLIERDGLLIGEYPLMYQEYGKRFLKGRILIAYDTDRIEQTKTLVRNISYATVVGTFLVLGLVLTLVLTRMLGPLTSLSNAMLHLADGNTETEIPGLGRSDEIGGMAKAVAVFRENDQRKLTMESERARQVEEEKVHQRHLRELIATFRQQVSNLISPLEASTANVSEISERLIGMAENTTR
ncbi:HAMP domain-containing protein [Roseibium sp.]|uniref:HAMP domain-containing protein n=1 Tax=Roseibium sp. TaxID=1936156 RepID=UPI003A96EDDF